MFAVSANRSLYDKDKQEVFLHFLHFLSFRVVLLEVSSGSNVYGKRKEVPTESFPYFLFGERSNSISGFHQGNLYSPFIPLTCSSLEWFTFVMRTNINALFLSKIMRDSKKMASNEIMENIKERRLFSRKTLPLGIQGDREAKMVVDSLVPHERRLLYEHLRRRVVEQYTESTDRVTVAVVPDHELRSLFLLYFFPSSIIGFVSTTILVFAGGYVESHVVQSMSWPTINSVAVGSLVANVITIFLHKRPILSIDQWQAKSTVITVHLAKASGMVLGFLFGLAVNYLIHPVNRSQNEEEEEKSEDEEE